ncbi:MAG: DnaJ domain-containing protein [Acidimicrobiia bacterium]|nr:DnaJ domain-containing protein [Acidimicrobiia bacterium]
MRYISGNGVDYYILLGVEHDATQVEIAKAFTRMSMQANAPFGRGLGGKALADLEEAFAVLSDPERRAAYDRSR